MKPNHIPCKNTFNETATFRLCELEYPKLRLSWRLCSHLVNTAVHEQNFSIVNIIRLLVTHPSPQGRGVLHCGCSCYKAKQNVRPPTAVRKTTDMMSIDAQLPVWLTHLNSSENPCVLIRFSVCSFTPYLTLFSKSFSTFPRGTSSLSVSSLYWVLYGVYHTCLNCNLKQFDS